MIPIKPSQIERVNALSLAKEDSQVLAISEALISSINSEIAKERTNTSAVITTTDAGRIEIHVHGVRVVADLQYLRSGDDYLGGRYEFFSVREDVIGNKTADKLGLMEFDENGRLRFSDSGEWEARIDDRDPLAYKFRGLLLGYVAYWVQQRMGRLAKAE
jgi:hypothetical protein